jgi:hypothetical protein
MKKLSVIFPNLDPSDCASLPPIVTLNQEEIFQMEFHNLPKIQFSMKQWPLFLQGVQQQDNFITVLYVDFKLGQTGVPFLKGISQGLKLISQHCRTISFM